MSYQLKRSPKLSETITLDDGTIIEVRVNVGEIATEFNILYNRVLRLQKQKIAENVAEFGECVIKLMQTVFGKKNTEVLLEYFYDDWLEMFEMIIPYIEEKFIPLLSVYEKQKREDSARLYKASKGKKFGKKKC